MRPAHSAREVSQKRHIRTGNTSRFNEARAQCAGS